MSLDPYIMKAVERLNYRVTVGDVATQAGLEVSLAEQGLLALASEAGGHLQVAETGDIVYLFPQDFRSVLRNKYLRLQLLEWWDKIWRVLFYLIRISFGIVLIASILLIFLAILIIVIASSASRDGDNDSGSVSMPNVWIGPDLFWFFSPTYYSDRPYEQRQLAADEKPTMNFLEAVFSFLFGDGDPNRDLEQRRWQTIGSVIRNNRGAIVAEQIAPYLTAHVFDQLGYPVNPLPMAPRRDVIQAVKLGSPKKLIAFCRAIQQHSPVGSYLDPVPAGMPGYESELVMAGGTFIDGSTSEFSADGPLREPYTVFCQGGTHWTHVAIALESAVAAIQAIDAVNYA